MSSNWGPARPDLQVDVGDTEPSPWAGRVLTFAGALMLVAGIFELFEGIQALANDSFFNLRGDYTYDMSVTAWGWIHLVLGLVVALVGLGLLFNSSAARVVAIPIVVLSMLGNFMFIPYYPLWAIAITVLDVLILWALVAAPTKW